MRTYLRLAAVLTAVSLCPELAVRSAHAVPSRAVFPAGMEEYVTKTVRLSDAERADLAAGKAITKLLDADPNTEIATFGAVWIGAEQEEYVRRLTDIERFERGGPYVVTKKISEPPAPPDFSTLVLPDDDVKGLRNCKVGDCNLKLSEERITAVRSRIDWKKPTAAADVNALVRDYLLTLVTAYRDGGNDRLAVYRDKDRPTFVAKEFQTMIDGLPALESHLPELKSYLLGYPRASLANSAGFFYWQLAQFGAKPTIRVTHVVIQRDADRTVVASKLLYASHYFWTALTVRVLVPDPARGRGFWLVAVSRCRSDGLSGFTGKLVRGRARGEAQKGVLALLTHTKGTLEKS